MKTKYVIKALQTMLPIAAIVAVMGNACSALNSSEKSGGSLSGSFCTAPPSTEFAVLNNAATASTVYGSQVLENMASCTNLGHLGLSRRTMDENAARSPSFSQYGYVGDVTSAMMMGVTALAVEVCNDLANKERDIASTNRLIFNDFNFATDVSNSDIDNALTRMARSCWGRNPTDEERAIVREEVLALGTNDARYKAIAVCTSVLASLDGIKQ